jgi:biopolymer transport protein ExbB
VSGRGGRLGGLGLALLAGLCLAAGASGETLQDLLEETRNARALEEQAHAEREREFLASRDQQKQRLEQARAARDAEQAKSQAVSAQFDQNELQLNDLETLLKAREGNLGELFGVTRQVAADLSSVVYNSLTSVQYPGRDQFFLGLAKAKALPSSADLERLWFEILREMTETGRVARFPGEVVTAQGAKEPAEVVRVGAFLALSNGRYLSFQPGANTLTELPRQPGRALRRLAEGVQAAREGYVRSIVDPSRGVLLALTVQRPNFWERIEKGEAVGYVILAVGGVGALCALYQFVYLLRVRLAVRRQLARLDRPTPDNPLGRVLASFRGDPARIEEEAEVAELRISEAVLRELPALERFQGFLRLAVAAGPLLGLIGTVIGMIITFQSITESGSSDPKLMANGIGQAMIATVLGLGIAIPLLFANAALGSLSDGVTQVLDEQSTGILAELVERKNAQGGGGSRPSAGSRE